VIGVISKTEQKAVVEEFFELFKTPWEFYRPHHAYDVIISTAHEMPEVDARLVLVCGPAEMPIDKNIGIVMSARQERAVVQDRGTSLPLYKGLLTFSERSQGTPCVTASCGIAGQRVTLPDSTVIRLGYDLFDEIEFLLTAGQPLEQAHVPTLELHIRMLRQWILEAGVPLLEVLPSPARHSFVVCLTHDIDFVGIRNHRFDHSMWGFVYRATASALLNFFRGRLSLTHLCKSWLAVASLPLVYAGWAKDFWEPFEWYLGVEQGLPATYFLIPFKGRRGEKVPGPHASRRATAYDITDIAGSASVLMEKGCELGVHGIDAWHSADKGREELARIASVTGKTGVGIRMHWLLGDPEAPSQLDRAGFAYDSTCGYNETIGYRAGTTQVFRPFTTRTLLELPLHIQDGALFFPGRLDLSEGDAEERCRTLIANAGSFGGVLTLLWHDRSHGPERFWGDFYAHLLQTLRSQDCWFGTAGQVVDWFSKRRAVRFECAEAADGAAQSRLRYQGEEIRPPLNIRVHRPQGLSNHQGSQSLAADFVDFCWNGESSGELDRSLRIAIESSAKQPGSERPMETNSLRDPKGQPACSL
jgi:hypothetical protein